MQTSLPFTITALSSIFIHFYLSLFSFQFIKHSPLKFLTFVFAFYLQFTIQSSFPSFFQLIDLIFFICYIYFSLRSRRYLLQETNGLDYFLSDQNIKVKKNKFNKLFYVIYAKWEFYKALALSFINHLLATLLKIQNNSVFAIFPSLFLSTAWIKLWTSCWVACLPAFIWERAALMRLLTSATSSVPLPSLSNWANTASTASLSCWSVYGIISKYNQHDPRSKIQIQKIQILYQSQILFNSLRIKFFIFPTYCLLNPPAFLYFYSFYLNGFYAFSFLLLFCNLTIDLEGFK